jgi:hypothetical protein
MAGRRDRHARHAAKADCRRPAARQGSRSGAWKNPNTFEMTWRYYETPHHDTVRCHFDGQSVRVEFMNSVTEMVPVYPETRPVLRARL